MFFIFISGIFCYSCRSVDSTENSGSGQSKVADFEKTLWAKADSTMLSMTLEEMVGQCLMPTVFSSADEANIRLMRHYISDLHIGGVVLLSGDIESVSALSEISKEAEVPLFMAIDAEWGLAMRLEGAPKFPKNGMIAKEADEMLLFDYGNEIARECRLLGINMVLGPVADVVGEQSGIIGKRSFGANPDLVENLAVAYAKGVEAGGVISVAKHFPGHGATATDSHRSMPVVSRDILSLDSIDLTPFRGYINSGLSGIMVGHISVLSLDGSGKPATVSDIIIKNLLQNGLGFKGLILTDALNMGGASGYTSSDAIKAGADLIVAPANPEHEFYSLVRSVKEGDIKLSEIKDKCRKILFYKYLTGYNNYAPLNSDSLRNIVNSMSHPLFERFM